MDLTAFWLVLLGFSILAYVMLDGFDLGLAMLFPLFRKREDRDVMMNSVAPVWDGNETWLVLGGNILLAAFPLAFAVLMPAVYAPLIAMLLGLIFRGVAFEYRWRTERLRWAWDVAFAGGSIVATLAQGVILGAILQGVTVEGRAYGGGWWDWLTPFSLLTGLSLVVGYILLGATWLAMKTRGALQERAYHIAWTSTFGTVGCIVLVSLATVLLEDLYWQRWFAMPAVLWTAQVPLLVTVVTALLLWSIRKRRTYAPFLLSLGLFVLSFVGIMISVFPYMVPPDAITIWEAAAPEKSQMFLLVGTLILLPLIITYTAYSYWVFRGKIDPAAGYH